MALGHMRKTIIICSPSTLALYCPPAHSNELGTFHDIIKSTMMIMIIIIYEQPVVCENNNY